MILKIPPQPLPIAEIGEKYIRLKISQKATGTIRLRKIPAYVDYPKILLTFNPISPILYPSRGDYSVVEKAEPDPLNLLANTNVGS